MLVYKFGGASVNTPDGVRNLAAIVRRASDRLLVIVSAMGKTTNALEAVLEAALAGDKSLAMSRFEQVEAYHDGIIAGLQMATPAAVSELYASARALIDGGLPADYDVAYDALVSCGEQLSTRIVSDFLNAESIDNRWIDMRECLITDARHRMANVLMEQSQARLRAIARDSGAQRLIAQGFIGATLDGTPTTLGREGSDYSAAVAANLLDVQSVTIWKDVPGILNADPRFFSDTLLIPELTYLDAVELAYSGAQVIHPKTIKPLQNKLIPLYVKPFSDFSASGSVIRGEMEGRIVVPIRILKHGQVLVSIRPRDFSFVLEERLMDVLSRFDANGITLNLIQTSAVNLSLCVDNHRRLEEVIEGLKNDFEVRYNDGMELLTIRGYTPELLEKYAEAEGVFLTQRTRRIVRIVRKTTK